MSVDQSVCLFVCLFPNSSKTAKAYELKRDDDADGLKAKKIWIRQIDRHKSRYLREASMNFRQGSSVIKIVQS